ncbi:MAG TPA: biopolymer transporter ExbD [Planctomycetota bacterium]|nr:biopolymer transporter ExbD [Planctomycetota bacterium]
MKLSRTTRRPPKPELNMASMIDVVFLLLIFFMCTSTFKIEQELRSNLPQAAGNVQVSPDDFTVRIRLAPLGTGVHILCDGQSVNDFDALVKTLEARRAIADMPVIIEGQPKVAFRFMVAALDACHRADLHRVAFSAKGGAP